MPPPSWGALSEQPYGRCLSHHPGAVRLSVRGQKMLESDLPWGSGSRRLLLGSRRRPWAARCRPGQRGCCSAPDPAGFGQSRIGCWPGDLYPLQGPASTRHGDDGSFTRFAKWGWKGSGKPSGSSLASGVEVDVEVCCSGQGGFGKGCSGHPVLPRGFGVNVLKMLCRSQDPAARHTTSPGGLWPGLGQGVRRGQRSRAGARRGDRKRSSGSIALSLGSEHLPAMEQTQLEHFLIRCLLRCLAGITRWSHGAWGGNHSPAPPRSPRPWGDTISQEVRTFGDLQMRFLLLYLGLN